MNYDQFVSTWTGKAADFDHAYGFQCVDLFNFYNRDVVGQGFVGTPTTGGAADLWNDYTALDGYTKVANSPTGIPPKGAVVVWAANSKATGPAGHVGIASGQGDINSFASFDQNYPTGSLPHVQSHSYVGVLGWYVPINQGDEGVITDTDNEFARVNDVFIRIRGRAMSRDEFRKNIVGITWLHMLEVLTDGSPEAIDAQHAQEVGAVAVRDGWQGQIGTLNQKTADLTTQAQAQGHTIDTLNGQIDVMATEITELHASLKAAQDALTEATNLSSGFDTATPPAASVQPLPAWVTGFVDWLKRILKV